MCIRDLYRDKRTKKMLQKEKYHKLNVEKPLIYIAIYRQMTIKRTNISNVNSLFFFALSENAHSNLKFSLSSPIQMSFKIQFSIFN